MPFCKIITLQNNNSSAKQIQFSEVKLLFQAQRCFHSVNTCLGLGFWRGSARNSRNWISPNFIPTVKHGGNIQVWGCLWHKMNSSLTKKRQMLHPPVYIFFVNPKHTMVSVYLISNDLKLILENNDNVYCSFTFTFNNTDFMQTYRVLLQTSQL